MEVGTSIGLPQRRNPKTLEASVVGGRSRVQCLHQVTFSGKALVSHDLLLGNMAAVVLLRLN